MKKSFLVGLLCLMVACTALLSACGGEKYLEGEWYIASEDDVTFNFTIDHPGQLTPTAYFSMLHFKLDKNNVISYTRPQSNTKYTSGLTDYYIRGDQIETQAFGGGDSLKLTILDDDSILYQQFNNADGTGGVKIEIKLTKRKES